MLPKSGFILSIGLAIVSLASAQNQTRVSYSQLADDIFFSGKEEVSYTGVQFYNDFSDKGEESYTSLPVYFYSNYYDSSSYLGGFKNYLNSRGAKKNISDGKFITECQLLDLQECSFENDLVLANMIFPGDIRIYNPRFDEGNGLRIDSCSIGWLGIYNHVDHPFLVQLYHSDLKKFNAFSVNSRIFIAGCNIENEYEPFLEGENSQLYMEKVRAASITIVTKKGLRARIRNCVTIDSNRRVNTLNFSESLIELEENHFSNLTRLMFKESNIYLPSSNVFTDSLSIYIAGLKSGSLISLSSLKNLDVGHYFDNGNYDYKSQYKIENEFLFLEYLRNIKSLYDHFKEVGNFRAANVAYVKLRETDYQKLRYIHQSSPTFQTFFDLNLNRLLKLYTNYGTEPAKALVISFYIIFIFGVFYFIFPSDWDKVGKSKLIQNYKEFIGKNDKGYFKPFLIMSSGFVISLLNATTLSLNAFTTLGFGNIPTKGLARYVCIIQGFIGWFLLSLFTVALINQAQF